MRRPPSYSESHIQLPKSLTQSLPSHTALPLLLQDTLPEPTTPPSAPELKPFEIEAIAVKRVEAAKPRVLTWAAQFTTHLMLISLFETLFFWLFVSQSENTALSTLVNSYANEILGSCATMAPSQRAVLVDIFNALVNVTTVNQEGAAAYQTRNAYNSGLVRNSWLYFGGLSTLLTMIAGAAAITKQRLPWRHIAFENLGLVTLLGLYEWMFFRTVVYQYKSISIPELDQMVTNEFVAECASQYRG